MNHCFRANARTRKIYDTEKWVGYEVVLDVWQEVFAWGILLVPKDIQPGERRPVVVCQHGRQGCLSRQWKEIPRTIAISQPAWPIKGLSFSLRTISIAEKIDIAGSAARPTG